MNHKVIPIGLYTTNSNGEILIGQLKPDSYVITEIEAPDGYDLDDTPQTIEIGIDGKTYKVDFKDQPLGSLYIKKFDENTREPLSGAEFKVVNSICYKYQDMY